MACALRGRASADIINLLVAHGARAPARSAVQQGAFAADLDKKFAPPGVAENLPSDTCDACGKRPKVGEAAHRVCARCRTRRYCSTACHARAWKNGHRQECAALCKTAELEAAAAARKRDS